MRDPGFRHPRRDTADAATRGAGVAPFMGSILACAAAQAVASTMLSSWMVRRSGQVSWISAESDIIETRRFCGFLGLFVFNCLSVFFF